MNQKNSFSRTRLAAMVLAAFACVPFAASVTAQTEAASAAPSATSSRAFLGIALSGQILETGVKVGEVREGFPAAKAGLQAGDVIVGFQGEAVNDGQVLYERMRALKIGDVVTLDYERDHQSKRITMTAVDRDGLVVVSAPLVVAAVPAPAPAPVVAPPVPLAVVAAPPAPVVTQAPTPPPAPVVMAAPVLAAPPPVVATAPVAPVSSAPASLADALAGAAAKRSNAPAPVVAAPSPSPVIAAPSPPPAVAAISPPPAPVVTPVAPVASPAPVVAVAPTAPAPPAAPVVPMVVAPPAVVASAAPPAPTPAPIQAPQMAPAVAVAVAAPPPSIPEPPVAPAAPSTVVAAPVPPPVSAPAPVPPSVLPPSPVDAAVATAVAPIPVAPPSSPAAAEPPLEAAAAAPVVAAVPPTVSAASSTGATMGIRGDVKWAQAGVSVIAVRAGFPAERAGIQVGDVITRFAGASVTSAEELRARIAAMKPGEMASINFIRYVGQGRHIFDSSVILAAGDGAKW